MRYYMYSNRQLELEANNLNTIFDKERLVRPKPIDVYDVVDCIKCTPDWLYLSPDSSIIGMTAFNDGLYPAWYPLSEAKEDIPKKLIFHDMYPKKTLIRKGTIVIDRALNENNDEKTENFSCIHECFHQILHKKCFKYEKNNYQYFCTKKAIRAATGDYKNMSAIEIIEHQANYAAASFLMPSEAVKSTFLRVMGLKQLPCQPMMRDENMNDIIKVMSDLFSVNFSPMLYRLRGLSLLE